MMTWVCERCGKQDASLGDKEKPAISITITYFSVLDNQERALPEKKEVCTKCFHRLTRAWEYKPKKTKRDTVQNNGI